VGRPTILTPDLQVRVCEAIEAGNTLANAAALSGIHRDCIFDWTARGRAGEQPFADFADAIARAKAKAEAEDIAAIRGALIPLGKDGDVQPDWRARAWYRERVNPEVWGARIRVEIAKEFEAATERLCTEFANEPEILDRCLKAIAGESGGGEEGAAGVAGFLPPER
jgi:hypothetical protein